MSIDLEQFHQVFFEESGEGLDIMEQSLMELDPDRIDSETINAIFRSAHSIKGGSATFGFSSIAEFTHVLETLLDDVRSDKRGLSPGDIDLLLRSVDCMREMLRLIEGGNSGITDESVELQQQFTALLENKPSESNESAPVDDKSDVHRPPTIKNEKRDRKRKWDIVFKPFENLFLTGNDPLRNIKALSDMGELDVECHLQQLPQMQSIHAENLYLYWTLSLTSECSVEDIEEIFEWIEEDCELLITENVDDDDKENNSPIDSWEVFFKPAGDILLTGNEPSRMLRELRNLGATQIQANSDQLPSLSDIDGSHCYLFWEIQLSGKNICRKDIENIFEWVADESDLRISEVNVEEAPSRKSENESEVQPQINLHANGEAQKTEKSVEQTRAQEKTAAVKAAPKKVAETSSIRVGIDKVDTLINMVGELVITQSMLGQLGTEHMLERVPKLMDGLSQLEQNTRELQECVMKIRMLPISFAFSRFPRMVRDLSKTLGKNVNLVMNGENTELDKTVMEKIGDPLVHLVRNAVDHGLETPGDRASSGKSDTGTITLNAFHQSGNVVIEIIDDGRGLNRERILSKAIENGIITDKESDGLADSAVYDLIFQPGFSTAESVSDVSGRGVGMDVVKRNIQALNGHVEIASSAGRGSTITIKLPLTLAILDGQLVRVGGNTYIFPLVSIIESLQCRESLINHVGGGCSVFKLRDDYVPIVKLHSVFSIEPDSEKLEDSLLVVVEQDGAKVGIVVDELLGQQQVVIKSLEQNYRRVDGVSGATILGDGTVALILDMPGIMKLSAEKVGVRSQSLAEIIHQFQQVSSTASPPPQAANG